MGNLTLSGATSGQITISPTAIAGTNTITLPAATGTSLISPVPSATLAVTPSAGAIEYDGKVFYGTPQGTQRGVIPGEQYFRLNADLAGANATGAQSLFGVGVSLSANTVYAFDSSFVLQKTAGTTSHTISIGFGVTTTINNILYELYTGGVNQAALPVLIDTISYSTFNSTTAGAITGAVTTANRIQTVKYFGSISVNANVTFTPQYTLSAAPGGAYSTVAGSYFAIYPIGTAGSNISVGTWA